jgi:hypothetical protein
MTVHHERNTDVLWIDFCPTPESADVEVMDVGEDLGFPGQILVRVDCRDRVLLGLIIQNSSDFVKRLMRQYRMESSDRGVSLLAATLRAGFQLQRALGGR